MEQAVQDIKNGQAGGPHGVIGEFVMHGGEMLQRVLHKLFTAVLEEERFLKTGNESG